MSVDASRRAWSKNRAEQSKKESCCLSVKRQREAKERLDARAEIGDAKRAPVERERKSGEDK